MNQIKIGSFLKELRKEHNLTQEQLAEHFGVSNRSVSRWENGTNMPDLSLLVEIADFYDVDMREILDGERKNEKMNKEEKETLLKVADYAESEKAKTIKRLSAIDITGFIFMVLGLFFTFWGYSRHSLSTFTLALTGTFLGLGLGSIVANLIYITGLGSKIRKMRGYKIFRVAVPCCCTAAIIILLLICASLD